MAATLTVLAAQSRPLPWDPEATLDRLERQVRSWRSAFPHVQVFIFPELFVTGEDPWAEGAPRGFERRTAEPVPGPLTRRLGALARRTSRWLCPGSMLELDGDRVYNTALVFAPSGRLAVRYRKVFPWRPFETVNRGTDAPPVFRIPGVGQLGVMICYDGSFPEMARSLALRGAEVILHPTLTSTPDRDQELVMAQANAIANQCYVLNVNAVSTYANGRSIGVDPHGRVLFELGEGESFAIETLDLDLVRASRRHGSRDLSRLLQHVREAPPAVFDAYRDLGDRT